VAHTDEHEGTRRDFLYYATAGAGAVAAGAAVWPLVNQMNPSADVLALAAIRVDVADVEPGTQITVLWQGKPVFIRRRTNSEIEAARAVDMEDLIDSNGRNDNSPDLSATDENRALDENGEWLVMLGVCTHLGCVPLGDGAGEFGGWFCPCHGSHYDTAGRIRKVQPRKTCWFQWPVSTEKLNLSLVRRTHNGQHSTRSLRTKVQDRKSNQLPSADNWSFA
jgi:ubiquinol-cytochrome c reductase iron-sulfur subunit